MKHNLLSDTCRLLRSWLQTDRIRTAPSVGKLLNLPLGSWLLFNQELYQIVQRELESDEQSATTTYALCTENDTLEGPLSMIVSTRVDQPRGSIFFLCGTKTIEAYYHDVTVLAERR